VELLEENPEVAAVLKANKTDESRNVVANRKSAIALVSPDKRRMVDQ
jgi:hypothetical protein